jgi:PmbA protein
MNKDMHDLASWIITTAGMAGAAGCRVHLNQNRSVEISYRDRRPENIRESSTRELGISFFVDGRYSGQNTSDLRPAALERFINDGVTSTRLLAEDPDRTLPDSQYYEGAADIDLELVDPTYQEFQTEDRHRMAQTLEASCLERGRERVISATAYVSDSNYENLMMASNGFTGYRTGTSYYYGAMMTARDEGHRRPAGSHLTAGVDRRILPGPEEVGTRAAENTLAQLGAVKLKTETMPVIIENRIVGRLFAGVLGALSGRSIQQKQSFLHDQKNKAIASRKLTLIDDPHIKKGLGSRLFDSEGMAARKMTIIEEGVLKEFYVDWYYSRKLGWEPTTGGGSNLVVPPGTRSVAEIMKDLGRGLLITGFIGGNSNPTTGDTSIGIVGRLFEGGEPTQAVAEMNIADNHLRFWHRLTEVADDPWIYSSWRLPSMVFSDVVVSGA